jgi:hypothetical protein
MVLRSLGLLEYIELDDVVSDARTRVHYYRITELAVELLSRTRKSN